MRDDVRQDFPTFTERFEGKVATFYNDILGLTTIAVGNLCNTVAEAVLLPMVRPDGTPAAAAEIAAEWHRVHDNPVFQHLGWTSAARGATCRLTNEGIDALVRRKMDEMDRHLAARYAGWEDLPYAAQMAILSMSWAAGPGFRAPHFDAALARADWATCAIECHLDDTNNAGLRPRNVDNRALFEGLHGTAIAALGEAAHEEGPTDDGDLGVQHA